MEYCKYLNPHINDGWEKPLYYVDRLNENAFKDLLIPILHKINENILCADSDAIYCKTDMYETLNDKVIPTLLTFDSGYNDINKSVEDKLKHIKQNSFLSSSVLGGCSITAKTNGFQYNTESDSILYFDDNQTGDITDNESYIKIVDGSDFMQRLENENEIR